jgi:hypothetical protein
VPTSKGKSANAALNVWKGGGAKLSAGLHSERANSVSQGKRVEGVADLPANWFMGGVALTGAEWRRRLGDSVVSVIVYMHMYVIYFVEVGVCMVHNLCMHAYVVVVWK